MVDRSTTTTEEFLHGWLVSQHHRLRPTTVHSYDGAIQRINHKLGKLPIQALTPLQIEKFYAELIRRPPRVGRCDRRRATSRWLIGGPATSMVRAR